MRQLGEGRADPRRLHVPGDDPSERSDDAATGVATGRSPGLHGIAERLLEAAERTPWAARTRTPRRAVQAPYPKGDGDPGSGT